MNEVTVTTYFFAFHEREEFSVAVFGSKNPEHPVRGSNVVTKGLEPIFRELATGQKVRLVLANNDLGTVHSQKVIAVEAVEGKAAKTEPGP